MAASRPSSATRSGTGTRARRRCVRCPPTGPARPSPAWSTRPPSVRSTTPTARSCSAGPRTSLSTSSTIRYGVSEEHKSFAVEVHAVLRRIANGESTSCWTRPADRSPGSPAAGGLDVRPHRRTGPPGPGVGHAAGLLDLVHVHPGHRRREWLAAEAELAVNWAAVRSSSTTDGSASVRPWLSGLRGLDADPDKFADLAAPCQRPARVGWGGPLGAALLLIRLSDASRTVGHSRRAGSRD